MSFIEVKTPLHIPPSAHCQQFSAVIPSDVFLPNARSLNDINVNTDKGQCYMAALKFLIHSISDTKTNDGVSTLYFTPTEASPSSSSSSSRGGGSAQRHGRSGSGSAMDAILGADFSRGMTRVFGTSSATESSSISSNGGGGGGGNGNSPSGIAATGGNAEKKLKVSVAVEPLIMSELPLDVLLSEGPLFGIYCKLEEDEISLAAGWALYCIRKFFLISELVSDELLSQREIIEKEYWFREILCPAVRSGRDLSLRIFDYHPHDDFGGGGDDVDGDRGGEFYGPKFNRELYDTETQLHRQLCRPPYTWIYIHSEIIANLCNPQFSIYSSSNEADRNAARRYKQRSDFNEDPGHLGVGSGDFSSSSAVEHMKFAFPESYKCEEFLFRYQQFLQNLGLIAAEQNLVNQLETFQKEFSKKAFSYPESFEDTTKRDDYVVSRMLYDTIKNRTPDEMKSESMGLLREAIEKSYLSKEEVFNPQQQHRGSNAVGSSSNGDSLLDDLSLPIQISKETITAQWNFSGVRIFIVVNYPETDLQTSFNRLLFHNAFSIVFTLARRALPGDGGDGTHLRFLEFIHDPEFKKRLTNPAGGNNDTAAAASATETTNNHNHNDQRRNRGRQRLDAVENDEDTQVEDAYAEFANITFGPDDSLHLGQLTTNIGDEAARRTASQRSDEEVRRFREQVQFITETAEQIEWERMSPKMGCHKMICSAERFYLIFIKTLWDVVIPGESSNMFKLYEKFLHVSDNPLYISNYQFESFKWVDKDIAPICSIQLNKDLYFIQQENNDSSLSTRSELGHSVINIFANSQSPDDDENNHHGSSSLFEDVSLTPNSPSGIPLSLLNIRQDSSQDEDSEISESFIVVANDNHDNDDPDDHSASTSLMPSCTRNTREPIIDEGYHNDGDGFSSVPSPTTGMAMMSMNDDDNSNNDDDEYGGGDDNDVSGDVQTATRVNSLGGGEEQSFESVSNDGRFRGMIITRSHYGDTDGSNPHVQRGNNPPMCIVFPLFAWQSTSHEVLGYDRFFSVEFPWKVLERFLCAKKALYFGKAISEIIEGYSGGGSYNNNTGPPIYSRDQALKSIYSESRNPSHSIQIQSSSTSRNKGFYHSSASTSGSGTGSGNINGSALSMGMSLVGNNPNNEIVEHCVFSELRLKMEPRFRDLKSISNTERFNVVFPYMVDTYLKDSLEEFENVLFSSKGGRVGNRISKVSQAMDSFRDFMSRNRNKSFGYAIGCIDPTLSTTNQADAYIWDSMHKFRGIKYNFVYFTSALHCLLGTYTMPETDSVEYGSSIKYNLALVGKVGIGKSWAVEKLITVVIGGTIEKTEKLTEYGFFNVHPRDTVIVFDEKPDCLTSKMQQFRRYIQTAITAQELNATTARPTGGTLAGGRAQLSGGKTKIAMGLSFILAANDLYGVDPAIIDRFDVRTVAPVKQSESSDGGGGGGGDDSRHQRGSSNRRKLSETRKRLRKSDSSKMESEETIFVKYIMESMQLCVYLSSKMLGSRVCPSYPENDYLVRVLDIYQQIISGIFPNKKTCSRSKSRLIKRGLVSNMMTAFFHCFANENSPFRVKHLNGPMQSLKLENIQRHYWRNLFMDADQVIKLLSIKAYQDVDVNMLNLFISIAQTYTRFKLTAPEDFPLDRIEQYLETKTTTGDEYLDFIMRTKDYILPHIPIPNFDFAYGHNEKEVFVRYRSNPNEPYVIYDTNYVCVRCQSVSQLATKINLPTLNEESIHYLLKKGTETKMRSIVRRPMIDVVTMMNNNDMNNHYYGGGAGNQGVVYNKRTKEKLKKTFLLEKYRPIDARGKRLNPRKIPKEEYYYDFPLVEFVYKTSGRSNIKQLEYIAFYVGYLDTDPDKPLRNILRMFSVATTRERMVHIERPVAGKETCRMGYWLQQNRINVWDLDWENPNPCSVIRSMLEDSVLRTLVCHHPEEFFVRKHYRSCGGVIGDEEDEFVRDNYYARLPPNIEDIPDGPHYESMDISEQGRQNVTRLVKEIRKCNRRLRSYEKIMNQFVSDSDGESEILKRNLIDLSENPGKFGLKLSEARVGELFMQRSSSRMQLACILSYYPYRYSLGRVDSHPVTSVPVVVDSGDGGPMTKNQRTRSYPFHRGSSFGTSSQSSPSSSEGYSSSCVSDAPGMNNNNNNNNHPRRRPRFFSETNTFNHPDPDSVTTVEENGHRSREKGNNNNNNSQFSRSSVSSSSMLNKSADNLSARFSSDPTSVIDVDNISGSSRNNRKKSHLLSKSHGSIHHQQQPRHHTSTSSNHRGNRINNNSHYSSDSGIESSSDQDFSPQLLHDYDPRSSLIGSVGKQRRNNNNNNNDDNYDRKRKKKKRLVSLRNREEIMDDVVDIFTDVCNDNNDGNHDQRKYGAEDFSEDDIEMSNIHDSESPQSNLQMDYGSCDEYGGDFEENHHDGTTNDYHQFDSNSLGNIKTGSKRQSPERVKSIKEDSSFDSSSSFSPKKKRKI